MDALAAGSPTEQPGGCFRQGVVCPESKILSVTECAVCPMRKQGICCSSCLCNTACRWFDLIFLETARHGSFSPACAVHCMMVPLTLPCNFNIL